MDGQLVYANNPIFYGPDDQHLDRHQVTELYGFRLDSALLRQRKLVPVQTGETLYACGVCGAEFVSEFAREDHGRRAHQHQ